MSKEIKQNQAGENENKTTGLIDNSLSREEKIYNQSNTQEDDMPPFNTWGETEDNLRKQLSRDSKVTNGNYRKIERVKVENKMKTSTDSELYGGVFEDALSFSKKLSDGYDFYDGIYGMLCDNSVQVEIKKRYFIKAIDEVWIRAIEDTLVSLDNLTRNPSHFIEETDDILPIEISRNITSRSLRHLSQHTNLIADYDEEAETVTPSKILNVFHDDTIMTYENKFINTLIHHLYGFVTKRYADAKRLQQDEKTSSLQITSKFEKGNLRGKINFGIEISEPPDDGEVIKNYTYTFDLWKRVVKLNSVVETYMRSKFVRDMGHSFIHPPVIHTNAINKNRDLRQCLALWEFIQSYNNIGFGTLVYESAERADFAYLQELYSMMALQYMIFRARVKNGRDDDKILAENEQNTPLTPKFVTDFKEYQSSDFDVVESVYRKVVNVPIGRKEKNRPLSSDELAMLAAIDVALEADAYWLTEEGNAAYEAIEKKREAEAQRLAEAEAVEKDRLKAKAEAQRLAEAEAVEKDRLKAEAEAVEKDRLKAETEAQRLTETKKLEEKAKRTVLTQKIEIPKAKHEEKEKQKHDVSSGRKYLPRKRKKAVDKMIVSKNERLEEHAEQMLGYAIERGKKGTYTKNKDQKYKGCKE